MDHQLDFTVKGLKFFSEDPQVFSYFRGYDFKELDEVKKEIELLRNEPLSQHELELVKSNMLGDLVKNNDTPFNMANNVGGMELYGIYPQYFNDHIAAIRAVTPEALLDVARRYFIPDELYVVVAGRMK